MPNLLTDRVNALLVDALARIGAEDVDPAPLLEVPPKPEMGDYAFPCFQLARSLRKSPQVIAESLAAVVPGQEWLDRTEVVGAYINFFLEPGAAGREVVQAVLEAGDSYGYSSSGAGETVVIDYSSPNIAKPFHVGHLRTTIIGHALGQIFAALGYRVVRLNYLGDWGTQFGKLIVAFRRWGDPVELENAPIKALLDLYVLFHREAERDESLDDEARAAFRALEAGGTQETELWQRFRDLSMQEFERQYQRLGIHFDSYSGESAYNDAVHDTIQALEHKELITESEGAHVVLLEDLPPCLITKKDGASLYATRDLSAAVDRYETYKFAHLFYVVGTPQQLHFKQVFAVLERLDYPWVDRLEHIMFGQIRIGDAQLSTRKGNIVYLEDLLDQAVSRAAAIIEERNPELEEKATVAEMVGIGAIFFNDFSHNRIKDISFDWEAALSFEGDTGPYVQYTHARAASLLRRGDSCVGTGDGDQLNAADLSEPETFRLTKRIAEYPDVIRRAATLREPSEIARYLLLICHDFNSFYHVHRIFGSTEERSRLKLVAATKRVLASGLHLLGIRAPEAM